MPPELPPPFTCKACLATFHWALRVETYKYIPLETEEDPRGEWILVQDDVLGELLAVPFAPQLHGGMPRRRSHLSRCRLPGRGPAAPAPKPDPTTGLAFPRRRAIGPFPSLDEAERRWAEGELPEIAKRWPGIWRTSHRA